MSDGQYTPSEVVYLAAQKNISTVSITDHDTVSGIEEGSKAAREAGIEFIPGIEISVKGNKELHILGYCVDILNPRLNQMCEQFTLFRQQRVHRILEHLNILGVGLTLEQVTKYADHGRIGRPHFARAMLEAGYVGGLREAFDKYLATPEFDKIERPKPDYTGGIDVIREAGGVAVLAHPAQLKLDNESLEQLLKDLISAGLKGIECYYSTHTKEQTIYYLSLAERFSLIVTAGSDFHGEKVKPDIKIGTSFDDKQIKQKLERGCWDE